MPKYRLVERMLGFYNSEDVGLEQPSFKQCVIADSSRDLAPKMIGDQAVYRSCGYIEVSTFMHGRRAFLVL